MSHISSSQLKHRILALFNAFELETLVFVDFFKDFLESFRDRRFGFSKIFLFIAMCLNVRQKVWPLKCLPARVLATARAVAENEFPVTITDSEHATGGMMNDRRTRVAVGFPE